MDGIGINVRRIAGSKVWWVSKIGLGTRPFHWEIYQGKEGRLLATSKSFYLLGSSGYVSAD